MAPHWALVSTPPCVGHYGTLGHIEFAGRRDQVCGYRLHCGGQIALARPAALVVGVGVVQVATRGATAAARCRAGRVAGPDQVLEFAAGPVAVLGSGVLARSADDRG
jgi:hypothetical protein